MPKEIGRRGLSGGGQRSPQQPATHPAYENKELACGISSGKVAMLHIKHILFPIDFSERCCAAVPFVDAMARQYGAKVTLLSVSEALFYAALGDPGGPVLINATSA
jgi:hypothetical protein